MHVADAVLAKEIAVGAWVVAGAATAVSLRGVREEKIPQIAVLTACFFVASTIEFPLPGGTSVHLVLNGLCGVILGPPAFLAIMIGLTLQFLLFSHGGLSTIGFNACSMGLPAVAAWGCFRLWCRSGLGRTEKGVAVGAFLVGGGAVLASALIVTGALALSGKSLAKVAVWVFVFHIPVAVIEGVVTALAVRFLRKVEPKLLGGTTP